MSNHATLVFEILIDEIRVRVEAIEQELADPTSDVCLSGSGMLDVHHQLKSLSERLQRCAQTVPPVDIDDRDELIARWEAGAREQGDVNWSKGRLIKAGDQQLFPDVGLSIPQKTAAATPYH